MGKCVQKRNTMDDHGIEGTRSVCRHDECRCHELNELSLMDHELMDLSPSEEMGSTFVSYVVNLCREALNSEKRIQRIR